MYLSDERAGGSPDEVPVLMYHSIASGAPRRFRRFAVDPGEFAAQMAYLEEMGYGPVTAAELAVSRTSGSPLPRRPVVITFDDAYADFYSAALPVLRKHDFSATLYVPTGYVGATSRFNGSRDEGEQKILSWDALRDITTERIEVAAHSHTHPQMDRVPSAIICDEVHRCRGMMEDKLSVRVHGFAYPFGYFNATARSAVAGGGFRYACAVGNLMTSSDDDVFTMPRLTVKAGIGVAGLARLLASRPTAGRRRAAAMQRATSLAVRRWTPVMGDPRKGWPPA
jgi:peptidoglycan/xylan/chitin deacetylase (PgdA/CDA1 family)